MKYYQQYFQAEIKKITYILMIVSLIVVGFDEISNYKVYPDWIRFLNLGLISMNSILLFLSLVKKIKIKHAFLIYGYLFTLNIYFPGFIGNEELRITIITSFSNLGACIIYIFVAGLIGVGAHVLILGGLNILCIFMITMTSHFSAEKTSYVDPVNILMFILTPILIYIMLRQIEKSLIINDKNKKKILVQEKELLTLKVEEERKRNHFLSVIQSENNLFASKIIAQLSKIAKEKNENGKKKLLQDLKQLCIMQVYKTSKSDIARWYKETDTDFIVNLKKKYPELTPKEQHICSLLRINLNTKEIADNLNMSKETIKWYRKRIRKKLGINDNQNLIEFLETM